MSEALDKVQASRARLRLAMLPPPPVEKAADANSSFVQKLLNIPVVAGVIESVQAWWSVHPMRPMSKVASEAANAAVQPIAKLHPVALVLAAAGAGALVFWTRPWRWIFRSALFAGLVPQLLTRGLASLPIDSWMSMVSSAMSRSPVHPSTPGEPAGQPATG
jgi:hypothetical protein